MIARIAALWQVPGLLAPMQHMSPLIGLAPKLAVVDGLLDGAPVDASMIAQLKPLRRIGNWVGRQPDVANALVDFCNTSWKRAAQPASERGAWRVARRLGPAPVA